MNRTPGLALLSVAALSGCLTIRTDEHGGAPQTDRVAIDLGKAEMVRAEIKMSAGELKVSGGAQKLLEADFRYNVPLLKPSVRYDATGFRGHLTVTQSSTREITLGHDIENKWDLRLSNDVPLDLILNMGAGESRFDLASLDLRRVEVHMGVGEMRMDLRGQPKRDYDVEIRGGIGEATVLLPADAAISAEARGGIGEIRVRGNLRKDGDRYVSSNYGGGKPTIRLDVRGGIGQINLVAE